MEAEVMQLEEIERSVAREAGNLDQLTRMMVVRTPEQAEKAGALARAIVGKRAEIIDWFKPMKDAAHRTHRAICEREKAALDRIAEPERIVKSKLAAWTAEQERARREALAAQEAERRRLEAEETARMLAEAEATGDVEQAERITSGEVSIALEMPEPPPPVATVAGISTAKTWSAEVVDMAQLVKAVAEGRAALNLLAVNQPALNGMARALKSSFAVPGCRAIAKDAVRVRA